MSAIPIEQIAHLVVRPALQATGLWSRAAELLVLGVGAQETGYAALGQEGGGPALGFWQMEPADHNDIWRNYLRFHASLGAAILKLAVPGAGSDQLAWNARYAAALCMSQFQRYAAHAPLPASEPTAAELAALWKRWWNTSAGKGTLKEFIDNYERLVARYQASSQ